MPVFFFSAALAAATTPPAPGFDINTILTFLGAGAGGVTAWKIVSLILDKIVPSRSDKRNDVEASFTVLSRTIEILSTEKQSDAAAVDRANGRIKSLEEDGDKDYTLIRVLKDSVNDLESRIALKDRHIAQLTAELARYGAQVTFDGEGHLHVASPSTGPVRTVA